MNTPLISVIVPVYNVEQYLAKCIDSILAQTYTNFELLLVNDGSPDNSGKICDEYAAKDSRIKVFHKENGGVSSARNLGIDNATGKWVSFIDSDDWIDSDMYKNLVNCTFFKTTDIIFFGHIIERTDKNQTIKIVTNRDLCFQQNNKLKFVYELEKDQLFGWTWNKIFRREIILDNKITFDHSLSLCEDHVFTLQFMIYVNDMAMLKYTPYHYRQVTTSLINKATRYLAFKNMLDVVYNSRRQLIEKCKLNCDTNFYRYFIENEYLSSCFSKFRRSINTIDNDANLEFEFSLLKLAFNLRKDYIKSTRLRLKYSLLFLPKKILFPLLTKLNN